MIDGCVWGEELWIEVSDGRVDGGGWMMGGWRWMDGGWREMDG